MFPVADTFLQMCCSVVVQWIRFVYLFSDGDKRVLYCPLYCWLTVERSKQCMSHS